MNVNAGFVSEHGRTIATYKGEGVLVFRDGVEADCRFEAGQLAAGDVVLLCQDISSDRALGDTFERFDECSALGPVGFRGTSDDGQELSVEKDLRFLPYYTSDLPPGYIRGLWHPFRAPQMSVRMKRVGKPYSVRFGLTNLDIYGTRKTDRNKLGASVRSLPVRLPDGNGRVEVIIKPVKQYTTAINRVRVLKGVDVTCEAICYLRDDACIEVLTEMVDALCHLLSVARGTKVQWIYRDCCDRSGRRISRVHFARVTKPFCPLKPIRADAGRGKDTKRFLQAAYPIYMSRCDAYRLNRGTIDVYLDAKAEGDYLATRGVKIAVAMEALKAVMLEQPGVSPGEYIIDEQRFADLLPDIKKAVRSVLQAGKVPDACRGEVYERLKGLNRRAFRILLQHFFSRIGLDVEPGHLEWFVASRNSLVHKGEFYVNSATPPERKRCKPLATSVDEYFFLVNFLDRVFLKLLGYDGPYEDWSSTDHRPTHRDHV